MKVVSIVGARPQFIKAAPLSRVLRAGADEILIHTGQHYDDNMSRTFFDELEIPRPDHHLGVGSGSHGLQTGLMLERIEKILLDEKPDAVLVYGDTNSTLAGAMAAAKLLIPLAHVEAGLRSFNRAMPEEINRVVADHCADWLLCPTQTAVENLRREGVDRGVHLTGDVMFDAALRFAGLAETRSRVLETLSLRKDGYVLCTVHRAENTDDRSRLGGIVQALRRSGRTVVFPLHPRTRKMLEGWGLAEDLSAASSIRLIDPVGYLDMIRLERNASAILTDSGGVQKEAYFYRVPCVTLRNETEWVETVRDGWNRLAGTDPDAILQALDNSAVPAEAAFSFGDGRASETIVRLIHENF
ncbi:UDP-N-acetylglucosamine 2-epimerase (non-hydrolyzing) [bacterium]|nr:UDP-N-acetylglucosamine 2-epimerase (non-hydrolyzing) [bacterium]